MEKDQYEEKLLTLDFTWQDEPVLSKVTFRFPGLRSDSSQDHVEEIEEIVSHEGNAFKWHVGPQSLSILIVRSVAAGLEGYPGFAISIPPTKSSSRRSSKTHPHPGKTLSNMLNNHGSGGRASFPWVWNMFGISDDAETPTLETLVVKSRGRIQMQWEILSPVNHVRVTCNGNPLADSTDLRYLAEEIESRYFPQARDSKSNIPRRRTTLLGREDECGSLQTALLSQCLVTLVGPGGCGKTDLSYEVARRSGDRFSDIRLVELAGLSPDSDRKDLEVEIARALSPDLVNVEGGYLETIANYIGRKTLLLVLDNCEHVKEPCQELLDELLDDAAVPNLRVLATSREELKCRGEKVVDLGGLSFPPAKRKVKSLGDVTSYASVALFLEKARNYTPKDADAEELAGLCRILEGMPYAIELVAAQTNKRTISGIAGAVTDVLSMGLSHAKNRHQRLVEASQEWSYNLLNEDQQRLLCRLTVFADSWTRESAVGICADDGLSEDRIEKTLDQLIDKSLVERSPNRDRYHLLVPTRQFAAKRTSAEEAYAVEERHLDYFLRFARDMESRILGAVIVRFKITH